MKTIKLFFLVLLFIIFFPFYVITKGVFESIDEELILLVMRIYPR